MDRFARTAGLTKLNFLKADIEGWEQRMLTGAEETIARFHPALFVEMVDHHLARAGDSLESAWALLVQWGYRPMRWAGAGRLEDLPEPVDGDTFGLPRP